MSSYYGIVQDEDDDKYDGTDADYDPYEEDDQPPYPDWDGQEDRTFRGGQLRHCYFGCGELGVLIWRSGRGGYIHCCARSIDVLYLEIDQLVADVKTLAEDREPLDALRDRVMMLEETLARIPRQAQLPVRTRAELTHAAERALDQRRERV